MRAKGGTGHGDFESETFIAEPGPMVPWPLEVADPISAVEGRCYTHEGSGNFRLHNVVASEAPIAFALRGREDGAVPEVEGNGDTIGTLRASNGGSSRDYVAGQRVRRLTPRECERLQGYPDDFTLISWKGRPSSDCPDGPRYKAIGNSMSIPVIAYIGERIAKHCDGVI